MFRSLISAGVAAVLLLCAGQARADADLPQDPGLRTGQLPNGLRYGVMRSVMPKGSVAIRFAVDVGSFEETDAERGFAHFVEHMAFRDTRRFPEGSLSETLAHIGVGAGRDHNAFTAAHYTIYQVDLPDAQKDHLDLAFAWLRDVADGLTFPAEAVEHERGVILAERDVGVTPDEIARVKIEAFQAPGLRVTWREPIGEEATLRSAGPDSLRRFHARWYRPDNAIVAMSGDMPVEEMEALIRRAYADWRVDGPPPARPAPGAIDARRGVEAISLADPGLARRLRICRVRQGAVEPDTRPERRAALLRSVWTKVLQSRLSYRVETRTDLVRGLVSETVEEPDLRRLCLEAEPGPDGWSDAAAALAAEIARLRRDGPTEAELETALNEMRSGLRGSVTVVDTEDSYDLANEIAHTLLARETFSAPLDQMRALGLALDGVSPTDVRLALAADWSGPQPLIDAVGASPPPAAALVANWRQAEASAPPEAWRDPPRLDWAYDSFGPPGRVVRRETVRDPGFVRLTFANGLKVRLMTTTFEKSSVNVVVRFGDGREEIAPTDLIRARILEDQVLWGGLGRHPYVDLQRALDATDWTFDLDILDDAFEVSARPLASNLQSQLAVIAAYLSDPGFRPQNPARYAARIDTAYREARKDPATALRLGMLAAYGPQTGLGLPSREAMGTAGDADLVRLFKAPMTQSPLTLTIVGDITEADAIRAISATLGALPRRAERAAQPRKDQLLVWPQAPGAPLSLAHTGPADRGAVAVTWPLAGIDLGDPAQTSSLRMLASIFETALTQEARERLGKTYSPSVEVSFGSDAPDLTALTEGRPADLPILREATRAVAQRLARGEITAQELEAARQPRLSMLAGLRQSNASLAGLLAGAGEDAAALAAWNDAPTATSRLSLTDIQAAARAQLGRTPIEAIAIPSQREAAR